MGQKSKYFFAFITAFTVILLATVIISASTLADSQKRELRPVDEAQAILDRLNKEYGTEMMVMTDEDWALYVAYYNASDAAAQGIPMPERWAVYMTAEEFEAQMRYEAEVTIPEMNRQSEEARARMAEYDKTYYESYSITPKTIAANAAKRAEIIAQNAENNSASSGM